VAGARGEGNATASSPVLPPRVHHLLMVLGRPEIPLHTNGSENDIRCQVTRSKISVATIPAAIAAPPSAASARPAPSSGSLSGITAAPGSPFRATPKSASCRTSSSTAALPDDRHGFCPSYRVRHGAKAKLSFGSLQPPAGLAPSRGADNRGSGSSCRRRRTSTSCILSGCRNDSHGSLPRH